ncbi:MAG: benzaldehyde dehydrogenase (NAD) [Rhodocyclaceae bacterium]|nr:MAG: benzaldehyde dehydrogenase (NAD) [Rhodocyclaceae bacterium]TND05709.1 MAG: benzaldehyde dehydrogenase (NAD) [Rhodocyclaceae bacterium]
MGANDIPFLNTGIWNGKLFLGGWNAATSAREILEPATGAVLTRVGIATPADATEAAKRAKAAQAAWVALPYEQRAAIFRKAAAIIERETEGMTQWIVRETGCIPPKAGVELHMAVGILHEAAGMITQPSGLMLPSDGGRISLARRVPHGVVGVISPFNFPLILSIRAVAPALAAGNTVVLKPDPQTPITGGYLIARVLEEAGLPKDCLQVLPGGADVGQTMCADPNIAMISFTGSTAAGRSVGELAGKHLKKVTLELGGKNRLIILDDADVDLAASCAAWGAYLHQGQICMTTGVILVHEKIAARVTEQMIGKATHLPVGDPATQQVALGPLISERQRDRVHGIVEDSIKQGAHLAAGGSYEGNFYKPTVLTNVKPGMRCFDEEVFGPVASIVTFSTEDEAVSLANNTEYGLSLGVISASVGRAMALANRIPTGLLHINDQTVADEPHIPFGGRGASGNGGRHGGPANWEEFTQWQWVTIKDSAPRYPF